jgi:hypothetical protein
MLFLAFFGGLAIGYWRWGREDDRARRRADDAPEVTVQSRREVKPDLFSAAEENFGPDHRLSQLSGFTTASSELEAGTPPPTS